MAAVTRVQRDGRIRSREAVENRPARAKLLYGTLDIERLGRHLVTSRLRQAAATTILHSTGEAPGLVTNTDVIAPPITTIAAGLSADGVRV